MFRKAERRDVLEVRGNKRPLRNVLVTGGCGFIGSHFITTFLAAHDPAAAPGEEAPLGSQMAPREAMAAVRASDEVDGHRQQQSLETPPACAVPLGGTSDAPPSPEAEAVRVVNLDLMDYVASHNNVAAARATGRYHFVQGDIGDAHLVSFVLQSFNVDTVVHFAAQSHVDNSFGNSLSFTRHNVLGTHNLLECCRRFGKISKFVHVSTDEVYGEVNESQTECATLNPTNPYAATKAAAEFIVKSYHLSFGLPCIITRGNNVYGAHQYPEKVIPRFLMLAMRGEQLTVQGSGRNARTFVHAADVARAFVTIVERGHIGEVYNIGSSDEHSVMDIARRVVSYVHGPEADVASHVRFVADRDFNDERYDVDTSKLRALGWEQRVGFAEGFTATADWYRGALAAGYWSDIRMGIADSSGVLR